MRHFQILGFSEMVLAKWTIIVVIDIVVIDVVFVVIAVSRGLTSLLSQYALLLSQLFDLRSLLFILLIFLLMVG